MKKKQKVNDDLGGMGSYYTKGLRRLGMSGSASTNHYAPVKRKAKQKQVVIPSDAFVNGEWQAY